MLVYCDVMVPVVWVSNEWCDVATRCAVDQEVVVHGELQIKWWITSQVMYYKSMCVEVNYKSRSIAGCSAGSSVELNVDGVYNDQGDVYSNQECEYGKYGR